MNKTEFIEVLAGQLGLTHSESDRLVNGFVEAVTNALKRGEEVNITGFGAFTVTERAARMGINPQRPGEKIQIPATRGPKFKAGKAFKDAIKSA